MDTYPVTPRTFRYLLGIARAESSLVKGATSAPDDMPETARYFVTEDLESGFGVDRDGTLIGVFSLHRGRGNALVSEAIAQGATRLDCFDGYLPSLYARHGFVEVKREANWTPGGPDVVFMQVCK